MAVDAAGQEICNEPAVAVMIGAFPEDELRLIELQAIDVTGFESTGGPPCVQDA